MRRFLIAAILVASLAPGLARAQEDQPQTLVDRATLAIQAMMTQQVSQDPRIDLQRARAVMICPRVFKAGFILGASGGDCVLLARAGNGTWSYPAFYTIGSGSIGFQAGVQDSALVMMIMTPHGLRAVLDSQFKLGADASVAIATIGGTVGGATTAAVGADIVVFAQNRGLFGGVSVEGSIMSALSTWNRAYYSQPYAAQQIVIEMQGANPGADPLREVLTRYGSAPAMPVAGAPGYPPPGQGYTAPAQGYPPPGQGYQGPAQGNPPPSEGYNGPAQGYPPRGQGYNPPAQGYPPPSGQGQGNYQAGPGYAPAYPPGNQYGGGSQSFGQPTQLQPDPSGQVQQQSLPPPTR